MAERDGLLPLRSSEPVRGGWSYQNALASLFMAFFVFSSLLSLRLKLVQTKNATLRVAF